MKSIVRIAVALVALAAAGCVTDAEVVHVSAAAPVQSESLFGELHAAIPAGKASGHVFEYN